MGLGALQIFQRLAVAPQEDQCRAEQAVADELVSRIFLFLREFDDLARERMRGLEPRREETGRAQKIEHGESLQIVTGSGIEQALGLGQGAHRLRRLIAPQRKLSVGARELQRELQRLPRRPLLERGKLRKSRIDVAI